MSRATATTVDAVVLVAVLPILIHLTVVALTGQPVDWVGLLVGTVVTLSPLCAVGLITWHLLVREGKREVRDARLRFLVRAVKASWVMVTPLLLIGARTLAMPLLLSHLFGILVYAGLRTRFAWGATRI